MLKITHAISINESEIEFSFIRSPGPGGQNVNKVETAVLLRFNAMRSAALSDAVRQRLITLAGNKMTQHGDIVIKASRYRTQERNKHDALSRLQDLLKRAATIPKLRRKTKPTFASKVKRLTQKKAHAKTKKLRQKHSE